jgi:predicted aspartyl protease
VGVAKTFDLHLRSPVHVNDVSSGGADVLLVPAKVNGLECLLLLDTGASRSILSEKLFKSIKLSGKRIRVPRGSNLRSRYAIKTEASITVGDIELSKFPFILLNLEHFSDGFSVPIQGVLGGDFLNKFVYSLNVRERTLRFCAESDINNVDTIPIEIRNNQIFHDLQIAGRKLEFFFDTGCSHAQISRDDARGFDTELREDKGVTLGINGKRQNDKEQEIATLRGFSIGNARVKSAEFPVGDSNIIGINLLEPFIVTVNPKEKYIKYVFNEEGKDMW